MSKSLNEPIELLCMPSIDLVQCDEKNEPFVDIYEYSNGKIKVDMQYAKMNISGAIDTAFVRETVAKKLLAAQKLLPRGFTFEILDAWRPYEVQFSLYNSYRDKIINGSGTDLSAEELEKKVCEFVSYPDKNKKISFVHSSGGAIDITILDESGKRLNMGSEFDEFTDRSYTSWYENNSTDSEIISNRRMLYNSLCSSGFTNYPSEWWHYDFGDAFWSFYTGEKAIYVSKFEVKDVTKGE